MRRYLQASITLLLAVMLLVPASTLAKGGGGFQKGGGGFRGGGGRSFSGGSRPGGFGGGFSSGRSFSTPKAPPSAPSRSTFKPSGGFSTHYDSGAAAAEHAQSSRSLYERANGALGGGRTS